MLRFLIVSIIFLSSSLAFPSDEIPEFKLTSIVKNDCGSCHGMQLRGGLGPSLVTVDFKKKDSLTMFNIIKYGKPGTPMPPWKNHLSDTEIEWIVNFLKNNGK